MKNHLPDFLILGAQRSGTSHLYRSLCTHPHIIPSVVKETHFFDLYFHRGLKYYFYHFPYVEEPYKTFEATPIYLLKPEYPKMIHTTLPEVKRFIILLRNPVERAESAFKYFARTQRNESRGITFKRALDREKIYWETARDPWNPIQIKKFPKDSLFRMNLFIKRGEYYDQIKRWFDEYPNQRHKFMFIKSEDYFQNVGLYYKKVLKFLDMEERIDLQELHLVNRNESKTNKVWLTEKMRARLEQHFKPHNNKLYELLDCDFGW